MDKYNKVLKNKLEELKKKELQDINDTSKSKEELQNNKKNVREWVDKSEEINSIEYQNLCSKQQDKTGNIS